jgi:hypothetical protein
VNERRMVMGKRMTAQFVVCSLWSHGLPLG